MNARIVTLHILVPETSSLDRVTDGLNETLGGNPGVLDWAYADTLPGAAMLPSVTIAEPYTEGDFLPLINHDC